MNPRSTAVRGRQSFVIGAVLLALSAAWSQPTAAQQGTLAEPFPATATNAALHYQRALLHLARLDQDRLRPLSEPIWEVLPAAPQKTIPHEIANLLYRGRFAIR